MFNLQTIRDAFGARPGAQDDDLVAKVRKGAVTLIDVRGHDEVQATGLAEGAVHIPLMLLQFQADPRNPDFHPALKPGAPLAVYCASGARSAMAERILKQLGHEQVTNIGGLQDWIARGGEIVR